MTNAMLQSAKKPNTEAEAGIRPWSQPVSTVPRIGRPTVKQPTFDWSATDKKQFLGTSG